MRLRLPVNNRDLAAFIGITPEHLSRLLKDLERDGLIRRENGSIVIGDVERLLATP